MSKLSEGKGVEIPVYFWLGKMSWTPSTSADLKVWNRPFLNPLIEGIVIENVSIRSLATRRSILPWIFPNHRHRFWVNLSAFCPEHRKATEWLKVNPPSN